MIFAPPERSTALGFSALAMPLAKYISNIVNFLKIYLIP